MLATSVLADHGSISVAWLIIIVPASRWRQKVPTSTLLDATSITQQQAWNSEVIRILHTTSHILQWNTIYPYQPPLTQKASWSKPRTLRLSSSTTHTNLWLDLLCSSSLGLDLICVLRVILTSFFFSSTKLSSLRREKCFSLSCYNSFYLSQVQTFSYCISFVNCCILRLWLCCVAWYQPFYM